MLDIENIKNQLKEQYKNNNIIISDLYHKIKVLNSNNLENRFFQVIGLSLIPWVALLCLLPITLRFAIPIGIIQLSYILLPTIFGITIEKKLHKEFKCIEKLKEFSNAKTEKEKTEQLIRYEIEKEKITTINKSLEKALVILDTKQKILHPLNEEDNITKKDKRTIEELELSIDKINKELEIKINEINVLITKRVIEENKLYIKDKFIHISNSIALFTITFITGTLTYNLPLIIYNAINTQSLFSLFRIFSPGVIAGITSFIYNNKKYKNNNDIFHSINNELCTTLSNSEINDDDLEKTITYIACLLLKLEEDKNKLVSNQLNEDLEKDMNIKIEENKNVKKLIKKY